MIFVLRPDKELAAFVESYWFVRDIPGTYSGHVIRTGPVPHAVLSVNLGRPNASQDGTLVPDMALLGLQSQSRTWRSWANTYFVMAMLTSRGIVHLFPDTGSATAGMLIDLAALTGDGPASCLMSDIGPEQEPATIAAQMDRWLLGRLPDTSERVDGRQIAMAQNVLRAGGTVEKAADAAQVSRRQLHRLFRRHLGVGPKELANLERLHSSLRNIQSGRGDPIDGFSDQSHQVRSWKDRLGVTPGAYTRSTPSALIGDTGAGSAASGISYFL